MSRTDKDRPWQIRAQDHSEPNHHAYEWHSSWHHAVFGQCNDICGWTYSHCFLTTPPHDFIRAVWWGPERARERAGLAAMAKQYNAGVPVTDDFANFHHRHQGHAQWC